MLRWWYVLAKSGFTLYRPQNCHEDFTKKSLQWLILIQNVLYYNCLVNFKLLLLLVLCQFGEQFFFLIWKQPALFKIFCVRNRIMTDKLLVAPLLSCLFVRFWSRSCFYELKQTRFGITLTVLNWDNNWEFYNDKVVIFLRQNCFS